MKQTTITAQEFINAGYAKADAPRLASDPAKNWKASNGGKRGIATTPAPAPAPTPKERLHNAAPDLLEACKIALEYFRKRVPLEHGDPVTGKAWGAVGEAIEAATGEVVDY